MKFFYKNEVCKRVLSMVLAFVMIFTMFAAQLPSGLLKVQAAENDMSITVHFDNSVYNWGEPAIQFWGGSLTPSNYAGGPTEISGWNGAQGYSLVNEENGWYSITLTGSCDGFQFVDISNPGGNTAGKGYDAYLTQYKNGEDVYFRPYEDNYNGKWYIDAACTTALSAPADAKTYDVTLFWENVDNWSTVRAHVWNATGDITGNWPGKEMASVEGKEGWYSISFEDLTDSNLNFIFNNGNGTQTGNLGESLDENGTEIWVSGGVNAVSVSKEAPESWNKVPEVEPEDIGVMNITVHFDNSVYNWGEPAIQFWGGSLTPSNYAGGPTEISGWGGAQGYSLVNEENGWYSITLTGTCDGFQFVDLKNSGNNTGGKGYNANLKQYTFSPATDLYFKSYEDNYAGKWYTDIECTTEVTAPADAKTYDVTLHWYNTDSWTTVNAYTWNSSNTQLTGAWPGTTVSESEVKVGWYDITLEGLTDSALNIIFNNKVGDAGVQTADLKTVLTEDVTDIWVIGGVKGAKVVTEAPAEWTNAATPVVTYDVTLHWYNADNWTTVNAYTWDSNKTQLTGAWPGTATAENTEHANWYDIALEDLTDSTLNFIFNNKVGDAGVQTGDLKVTLSKSVKEVWVTGGASNPVVATEAPELWTNGSAGTETYTGDVTLYVHYTNPQKWSAVNLYTWNPASGANPNGAWPGTAMKADADNAGWYTASGYFTNASQAGYIFNSGSTQTADAFVDFTAETMHLWVDGNGASTTAPAGWVFAEVEETETSDLYVRDVIEVEIGGEVYAMSPFTGGVFETVVELEAGTYSASLIVNGVAPMSDTEIVVENAGKVAIRLTDEGITATAVKPAALVGNLKSQLGVCADWDPANVDAEMTYLGNGLYTATLKFAALAVETALEYKVAFNDNWDYSIGSTGVNGSNVAIKIPAGTTSLTVLVDENTAKLYDDVTMSAIKVNGADMNPLTTTVSLIGTVRGLGGDDWNTGVKGYEFTRISDTLYRYEMTLGKGTHSYKAVFDYSAWYDIEGSGNRIITLTKDDVKVVFLYDTVSGYLFDTVNNEEKVASLLGMKARPAEMEIIENANGTATFVAVAKAGQKVTLYYGEKAEVEAKGAAALTKVAMGAVSNGKSSSEEIWLGDAALDLVYYYDINGTRTLDGSKPSVKVGGAEYSNYARPAYEGRVINVPGTFPGPSWDAASNQMTYNGNRTYSYTFENVPAAKYEFKIAVNGSWAENYGVGGAFDGGNMKVSVPTAQDVTIYYSDVTHYAVNSIDYKFANITLTGKNIPEGTKLTDEGLTGIYSVTVTLPAGKYEDVVLNCDGTKYEVAAFTLSKAKAVTFCMDPVTSIFYHDASNVKIETAEIYYDSKDSEYKNVFGAIATGEEVTFTLATGKDVSSASLVVKGNENKSVAMTRDGEAVDGVQKWSATITLSSIGEYAYYFVVSNGASVQCYGDDDGYYGTGTVAELTNVKPYDLVVYEAGFETPDWMKNAVIYQIFPDRFYDGDASNNHAQESARGNVNYEFINDWYTLPENPEQEGILDKATYESTGAYWGDRNWSNEIYGGDLEGITERIDYLKALGVTVIYLNPVFSSISNHRYDACDYTEIDPILGTEGDFAELVRVAEKNGMKVVLDGVFNHVSDDSIYFDRYYKFIDDGLDTIGAYPYWAFVYDYMAENDVDKAVAEKAAKEYFTAEYGITDYSYVEWFDVFQTSMKDGNGKAVCDTIGQRAGKPVYGYDGWWGYDSMPIIKSTNGSEYQTGDWAEEIIYNEDGTSVTQYWISQGMDGWRLDVANEVSDETWQRFRESVKALNNGEAVIIGEIWDDATKYILGDMYDSVMNYMFRNAVTGFAMGTNAEETTKYMERLRERYPEEAFYAMMNLVGSHDTTRILSYLDGIGDDRNQKDINSAFPTYENTSWDAKQRQYLVAFLQFTYAGAPTIYYGDEIGMVGSDDPDDRRAFEWGKGNKELVTYYATLAEVRNTYSALRTGSVETFDAGNNNVLAYVRRDAKNEMIVLANNGTSAVTVTLDLAELDVDAKELRDLLDDSVAYEVSGDKATVTVAARRGVILVDKHAVKNIKVNEKALAVAYDEKYVVPEVSERPYDKPEKPSKPSKPGNSGNNGNSDDNDSVTTPVFPSLPVGPGNNNRPNRAERDEEVVIEDIDTPLTDGKKEDVQEEKEPVEVETEIVEAEVPLTAGAEEGSAMPIVVVLVVLLAACGSVIIFLQKKKAIVK